MVQEITPAKNTDNFIQSIVLMQYEDSIKDMPVGGEGPPTITISIFKNTKKQQSRAWADEHKQYSNINLKMGDVTEAVVGGANAICYMADGLYASENVVVAHGENVYVISGMFLDAESSLRKDFAPFIESIRFTPQAGQE